MAVFLELPPVLVLVSPEMGHSIQAGCATLPDPLLIWIEEISPSAEHPAPETSRHLARAVLVLEALVS